MKNVIQLGTIILACCCLSGCGDSNPPPTVGGRLEPRVQDRFRGTPQTAAREFAELWDSGQQGETDPYLVLSSKRRWDHRYLNKKDAGDTYQLLDWKSSGDKAAVQYTRKNETEHTVVILLMKIDGQWKITGRLPVDNGAPAEAYLY